MAGWCLLSVPLKHRELTVRRGWRHHPCEATSNYKNESLPSGALPEGFSSNSGIEHQYPSHALCWPPLLAAELSSRGEIRTLPVTRPLLSQQGRVNFTDLSDPLQCRCCSQRAAGVISSHRAALALPGKGQSCLGVCVPLWERQS